MHFLGMINQITFHKTALNSNFHIVLHKTGKGRVVVSATHMICTLAFSPKRKLLVGTIGPRAEEQQTMIVGVSFVIPSVADKIVCSKMLSKMIFARKYIYAGVSRTIRTWKLRGLVPVSLRVEHRVCRTCT